MREVGIRSGWLLLGLGLLAVAGGLRAAVIEHSGPILADTVWRSSDEHRITGDVTVYPQVTLSIEAGATIRVAAAADSTVGWARFLCPRVSKKNVSHDAPVGTGLSHRGAWA